MGQSGQELYLGLDHGEVDGTHSGDLIGKHLTGAVLGLRGVINAVGRIMGEQVFNILNSVDTGGMAGGIKLVKAGEKVEDVAKWITFSERIPGAQIKGVYNAMTPGMLPDRHAVNFAGGRYEEVLLTQPTSFVRIYGGRAEPIGRDGTCFYCPPGRWATKLN